MGGTEAVSVRKKAGFKHIVVGKTSGKIMSKVKISMRDRYIKKNGTTSLCCVVYLKTEPVYRFFYKKLYQCLPVVLPGNLF